LPPFAAAEAAAGERGDGDRALEASRQCAEEMVSWLDGPEAAALAHAELEDQLDVRGRGLLRTMLQDHLSLRAVNEVRMEGVVDSDGVAHGAVKPVTADR
jgi:hypothetical protein